MATSKRGLLYDGSPFLPNLSPMFQMFLQNNIEDGDSFPLALSKALRADQVRTCMNIGMFEFERVQAVAPTISKDDYTNYFVGGLEAPLKAIAWGYLAAGGDKSALSEDGGGVYGQINQKLRSQILLLGNLICADPSGRSIFPVVMLLIENDWYATGVNASWMNYASMLDVMKQS